MLFILCYEDSHDIEVREFKSDYKSFRNYTPHPCLGHELSMLQYRQLGILTPK